MGSKKLIASALAPAAALHRRFGEPTRRLWAYARLRAHLGANTGAYPSDVDESVVVMGMPEIRGTGNIRLGKNLYLYRELYWETQQQGAIQVGDGVVMSRGVHIVSFSAITIGDGAMIGEYSSIRDANHRFGDGQSVRESGHDSSPISIGKNAWVSRGVTILPGVSIGDHAIVGANAVVTKDVADGEIVAGIPAKPMGSTFTNSVPFTAGRKLREL